MFRATTRTVIPLSRVKIGRMWPNSPDCSVLVVDETVMNRSCAWPATGRVSGVSTYGTKLAI